MTKEQSERSYKWWIKLRPLYKKFIRETVLNGYDKEDLEQECYLLLVKCLEQFDKELGVPFESYYKIQLYGWRSNQNRKKREYLSINEEVSERLSEKVDETIDIEAAIESKIFLETLLEATHKLQEIEEQIVLSYYLQNRTLKEIASSLGIPYKTASNKKTKALKKLGTCPSLIHI